MSVIWLNRLMDNYAKSVLTVRRFTSLAAARAIIEVWRVDNNTCRSHSSLGPLIPSEFINHRQEELTAEVVFCSR